MTTRADLTRAVYEADKAIDALFEPLPAKIAASVRRNAEQGTITAEGRLAILKDTDALLDTIYGTRKGGPSPLADLIGRRANLARMLPVNRAVADMQQRLPADLVAEIRKGVNL